MSGDSVQRAQARVHVGAVARNCAHLASRLRRGTQLCVVVKADGYGHGAVECARAALEGGASRLAVAASTEAEELRGAFEEIPILTMGALTRDELDLALRLGSEITVWRPEFLRAVATRAAELETTALVHVKYDTGMGRLGERDPETVRALVREAAETERVEPAGLWTHLSTADDLESEFFDVQLARFRELALPLKEEHPSLLLHAANSAATLRDPGSHLDMVRCGIAIYGLDPFHEDPADRDLVPALELHSHVAAVKRFARGDSVGYGRTWRAPRDTWIGVLPIGYGDGVRRGLDGKADVLVGGRRHPLVGTVSMDNVTIDLGPNADVEPGADAVLIGSQGTERILAEEMARHLGTINYEITCGISSRVPRVHEE